MELKGLHKLFAKLFLIVLLAALTAPRTALAMPDIFPFDQLQSGMSGKAYTVVDGSGKIDSFDVQILAVTDEGKGSKRIIMAKASGDVIRRTGGVLQGMSGSPVYINGKLVGALAATLKEMDPYTFFITPIENMLEMWTLPDPKAEVNRIKIATEPDTQPADDDAKPADDADKPTDDAETSDKPAKIDDAPQVQEACAFYLGGFDSNGAKFLLRELQSLGMDGLQTTPKSVERGIDLNAKLEPGSALGVAVIYGDFSLGATGTVTAVDGKKILAFGHPFTHAGNVNFFMTDASVIGTTAGNVPNMPAMPDSRS